MKYIPLFFREIAGAQMHCTIVTTTILGDILVEKRRKHDIGSPFYHPSS